MQHTPSVEAPVTVSIAAAAKLLGVGRKRASAFIRAGKLRLLGGNPTRKERMPMNAKVLMPSIREMLELPAGALLPGDRELHEPRGPVTMTVSPRLAAKLNAPADESPSATAGHDNPVPSSAR